MVALAVAVIGLRFNSSQVNELRNEIIAKDLAGASAKEEISRLREFVFSHMNSSVEFELTGSYERAQARARGSATTGELYERAQASCDRQGVSSVDQASCVQAFLNRRTGSSGGVEPPPKSQFRYSFASPSWSPDLAGFGLLAAAVFFIWGLIVYTKNQFRGRQLW